MATKKKYPTVEENLARRKYYNGTRPVATTSNGMGPVYIDTGDGHHNDTAYTPSQPHYFNPNKADTSGAPTYKAPEAYKAPEPYKAPEAYKAPEPYKAPEAYKAPNFADYQSRDYTTPEFKSGWGDQLQSLYNQIAGRGQFTYDQSKDPLYQQYAEMYRKNAQLAMSDTVAKAASLTGGYGNSYAETAGQSMYNQTMDQLNERALDLYDRALNAWALEGDQLNQRFNMAGQMYSNDYNAWRDQVSDIQRAQEFDYNRYINDRNFGYDQYINERNFGYDQWRDARDFGYNQYINERNFGYDQWRDARDFGYSQYRDAVGDARWQYETDYGKYRDSVDDAWRQKTFDNDNYWRKTELDNDNYWRQQQFDWDKETYNRDDVFRYGQLGEQQRQFDAGLGLDYAQLAEQARQYNLGYGLDAFNAGYDPVTGRMTDEAKARQDAADEFQYWQAGYDPATKGMSAEAKQQYKDSLALDYAKLGMNPDGSLNAIGQQSDYKAQAKGYEEQLKKYGAQAGNTPNAQQVINGGRIPTREQFDKIKSDKTANSVNQYGIMGSKGGQVEGKYYKTYNDYVDALVDSMPGLTEDERTYLVWAYTH